MADNPEVMRTEIERLKEKVKQLEAKAEASSCAFSMLMSALWEAPKLREKFIEHLRGLQNNLARSRMNDIADELGKIADGR